MKNVRNALMLEAALLRIARQLLDTDTGYREFTVKVGREKIRLGRGTNVMTGWLNDSECAVFNHIVNKIRAHFGVRCICDLLAAIADDPEIKIIRRHK